jgi:sugar phosphate isomerase/epimerase
VAVFIACSTLCFARQPLDRALQHIADLGFTRVDVAIQARGPHLTPTDVVQDMHRTARRLKLGAHLVPAAFNLELEAKTPQEFDQEFQAICHMARHLAVATLTLPAAPVGSDFDAEVQRLTRLQQLAAHEAAVLTVETRIGTLTETPDAAVKLCERVPGLGLTLDPSHYICGPHQNRLFDQVFPYVRHVHLRDTGRTPDKMQVRVGQGELEYGRLISQLERVGYDRALTVEIVDVPDAPFVVEAEVRKLKYLLESLV